MHNEDLRKLINKMDDIIAEAEYVPPQMNRDVDYFTKGYVEAMFFTNDGEEDQELYGLDTENISEEAWQKIISDCESFQSHASRILQQAYDDTEDGYDDTQAGRDFWFTRNGHGVGFWDRGLGDIGDQLTNLSKKFGEIDAYRGDDGQIYMSGGGMSESKDLTELSDKAHEKYRDKASAEISKYDGKSEPDKKFKNRVKGLNRSYRMKPKK